jgi:hypothetical protein
MNHAMKMYAEVDVKLNVLTFGFRSRQVISFTADDRSTSLKEIRIHTKF